LFPDVAVFSCCFFFSFHRHELITRKAKCVISYCLDVPPCTSVASLSNYSRKTPQNCMPELELPQNRCICIT
jgi:hypothetical protein